MNTLRAMLVLLPALVLTGCGGGDDKDQVAQPAHLGREFVIGYGKTVNVESLSITFAAVTEDSRCPLNAACVALWEGNARIQLAVTNGRVSNIIELNTNPAFPTFAIFEEHIIELRHLDPLPWSPPRSPGNYEATLLVDGQVGLAAGP